MGKKKILLVDDELFIRELIRDCLENTQNILEETESIKEAKIKLDSDKFDLVILDWNLGRKDSNEIIDIIKVKHKKTPVVLITGDHHLNLDMKGNSVVKDIIYKPFHIDKFLEKINKVWGTDEE